MKFEELKKGDVFVWESRVFMKIIPTKSESGFGEVNAICVSGTWKGDALNFKGYDVDLVNNFGVTGTIIKTVITKENIANL